MSYLTFLVVFLLPPILALSLTQPRPLAGVGGLRARVTLPLMCLIAFLYTTPWDNYLVYKGVWDYGLDRVLATIGYVPLEEYLFFLLQPVLCGLFLYQVLARWKLSVPKEMTPKAQWIGASLYFFISVLGLWLLVSGEPRYLYLGLILAWACPVLLGMWFYAGAFIWRYRKPCLIALVIPTLYLWIADALAIRWGIWNIADRYSLNFDPLGLPVEEAAFFLMTNLLVVQGSMLFLFGDRIAETRQGSK
ncbi:MAG TPA: lycopene cyclase domain-containing protein [Rhodothermales bacterium]|nr:lycopene cyclase domain-containing protein [Rhodothermales bacterium]